MSSNNYQIYINQTLQLAETLVIKSAYTAHAMNEWVQQADGYFNPVDPDPATWKYYLNLAGEYHRLDTLMTVVSLDTLEEIVFNKANLVTHSATSRAYQYGTRQYADLVKRYPDQEQLILGILYPADLNTAVNAKDGQILTYPAYLVEPNEYGLIARLQKWIYHYKQRWYVPGFDYTDELYSATILGQMYALLVQAILTARLAACNTNEAHSFHVREYLASHGGLDKYLNNMTLAQSLYFYRNIAYIERHAGCNKTFDLLTEHIMTERRIPLAEYTMKHDVSQQTENLYPEVLFRQRQLNLGLVLPPDNGITVEQLLNKEATLSSANNVDLDDVVADVTQVMQNSSSNVVATKVLESSMVDEANSSPWVLSEILFNHWLYLSCKNIYTAYINLVNRKTGEQIPLTAKEAFTLAVYAFAKTVGETLVTVPKAYASRVQRIPMATVDDIYSIVDPTILDRSVAEAVLAQQPKIGALTSIDAFYNVTSSINDAVQMQRFLIAGQGDYQGRAMVQAMVTRIYNDYILDLEPEGTVYDTWLIERNIELSAFNREDYVLLYNDLVNQATGASLHPQQSLAQTQAAMVAMFSQLSSYGIQIIAEINDGNIRKTDWPGVRPSGVIGELDFNPKNPDASIELLTANGSMDFDVNVSMNRPGVDPEVHQYGTHRVSIDLGTDGDLLHHPTTYLFEHPIANIGITSPDPTGIAIPRGWVSFIGIEYFLNLTPDQIGSISDPYNPPGIYTPPTKIPLTQVITVLELEGLDINANAQTEPLTNSITDVLLGKTYPE